MRSTTIAEVLTELETRGLDREEPGSRGWVRPVAPVALAGRGKRQG